MVDGSFDRGHAYVGDAEQRSVTVASSAGKYGALSDGEGGVADGVKG